MRTIGIQSSGRWGAAMAMAALMILAARISFADDKLATIRIHNEGSTVSEFLVRDENCIRPEREACEEARVKLASGPCLQDPASQACLETRSLAEGSVCRSDLLYDGPIPVGTSIQVKACLSPGGYAGISVRGRDWNTTWHRHLMLNDGDTVKYP